MSNFHLISKAKKSLEQPEIVLGVCGKGRAAGKYLGLPGLGTAGTTTDPLQDMAKPISQACCPSVKTCLRKGKNKAWQWGASTKVWEAAQQTSESVQKEGEEVLQALEHRFPVSPWRRPWWSRQKEARRQEQRETAVYWLQLPTPDGLTPPTHCIKGTEHNLRWYQGRVAGALGVKEWSWAWGRRQKRCGSDFCIFVSCYSKSLYIYLILW